MGEGPDPSRIDFRRRNVVRLYFTGESIPDRDVVAKDIIIGSLQFTPLHIFAFIHISGSRDFDLSFRNVAYLDLFWSRYEKVKCDPLWKDFKVIKISENANRLITILFKSESVSASDISFWLKSHCKEVGNLKPIYDKYGFWIGGYKVAVKLCSDDSGLHHLPNFITIGRDRGYLFYPGQLKVCHKCGSARHFGADCAKLICSKCGLLGHLAKDCKNEVKRNLCNNTGHIYASCPMSEKNGLPSALLEGLSVEEQMDRDAEVLMAKGEKIPQAEPATTFKGGSESQNLQSKNVRDLQNDPNTEIKGKRLKKLKNLESLNVTDVSASILNTF
uniref:CCHC-type domain-containing protein n=1 Tax=Latimeria chalumnae TaxID=7897 RepID=H2ZYV4_LATCH